MLPWGMSGLRGSAAGGSAIPACIEADIPSCEQND